MKLTSKEIRNLQLCEFECLKEIKRICEKNSIPYFLIGGTLIGAVRHKSFIPWDDDVDVGMLRKDYDTFLEVAQKDINKEKFFLQTTETENGCCDYEIARVRLNGTHLVENHRENLPLHDGFFVEIMAYDDLPKEKKKCIFYSNYFKYMKKILGIRKGYRYLVTNNIRKRKLFYFVANLTRIIPFKILHNKMKNYHLKYYETNSEKVFLLAGAYNCFKESHLRETVSEYTKLEFEGELFNVPKNYDTFLREQYGDYMQLPPEKKRKGKLFIKKVDFGEYLIK